MHELWLCKSILEIVKHHANIKRGSRIKKIYLEIGQLAAVDPEALNFSFGVIAQGTVAEGAHLLVIDIPAQAFCEFCQQMVPLRQYYDPCQTCGSHSLRIVHGEEMQVKSMELE